MANFSGNFGCSIPGGVNLTHEILRPYDYVLEDQSVYNYLTKVGVKTAYTKSNLNVENLFNRTFFHLPEKFGNYTYSSNGLYSGILSNAKWDEIVGAYVHKGIYLHNDYTQSEVKFLNTSNSGYFSIYCKSDNFFATNTTVLESASKKLVQESATSGLYIEATTGTNGPIFYAAIRKTNGDLVSVSTIDSLTNAFETDGILLTYRNDNKLRIYSCLRDGRIVSGETSTSFTRMNNGNSDLIVKCPYSGYLQLTEFATSNSGLSDSDVSSLSTLHHKITDRLSSNTSVTPNSGDYHIVNKIDYNLSTSSRKYYYFGEGRTKISGSISSFYDIAHAKHDTLSEYSSLYNSVIPYYRFKEPCDSGVIIFETWCEFSNPVSGATLNASMDMRFGNRDFKWNSNSGTIQHSGVHKISLSGQFLSSVISPTVLGQDINFLDSLAYVTLPQGSVDTHSDLKIYSARYYLTGWASPPTGVINSGTLFISGKESCSSGTTLYLYGDVNSNIPMYISGPTVYSGNKNTTLFIRTQYGQSGQPTNNIPLYIRSYIENSGQLPLYIGGPSSVTVTNNMPLYLQNTIYSGTNSIPLVIRTQYSQSGEPYDGINLFMNNIAISSGSLPLYINGPSSHNINDSTPLYIAGPTVYSFNNIGSLKPATMFIANNFGSGTKNTTLYVSSKVESSGTYTLHTIGGGTDRRSGNTTLFVSNFTTKSSGIPLYMTAGINEYFMNLVVGGKNYDSLSGNFPLFINATTNSGVTDFTTLYIESTGRNDSLPLFMKANASDENNDRINLYIHNDTTTSKQVDMFIKNSVQATGSGTRLFVKGTGQNNGFYAAKNSMNLYINRGNDSVSKSTVLYLESVKQTSGTVNMFIDATRRLDSGVTMVVPSVANTNTNNISLYTHGY